MDILGYFGMHLHGIHFVTLEGINLERCDEILNICM